MRRTLVRVVAVGAVVAGALGVATGTAAAEQVDCAKLNRGYDWALANLVVSDGMLSTAFYRSAVDYYAGELDAGKC